MNNFENIMIAQNELINRSGEIASKLELTESDMILVIQGLMSNFQNRSIMRNSYNNYTNTEETEE